MSNNKPNAPDGPEVNLASLSQTLSSGNQVSNEVLTQLLTLLLAREARQGQNEAAQEKRTQAISKAQQMDSMTYTQDMIRKQKNCTHLKGGKSRTANQVDDFNVYYHLFPDQSKYIKCNGCSMKWRPKDTVEFLVRGGKSYHNYTEIGWREASRMAAKSSNKSSTSEIFHDKQEAVQIPQTSAGEAIPDMQF